MPLFDQQIMVQLIAELRKSVARLYNEFHEFNQ
jgi:hypothetical protein